MKFEVCFITIVLLLALIGLIFVGYAFGRADCGVISPIIIKSHSTSTEEILSHSTTTIEVIDEECAEELHYCWTRPEKECDIIDCPAPVECDYTDLTNRLEECLNDLLNDNR